MSVLLASKSARLLDAGITAKSPWFQRTAHGLGPRIFGGTVALMVEARFLASIAVESVFALALVHHVHAPVRCPCVHVVFNELLPTLQPKQRYMYNAAVWTSERIKIWYICLLISNVHQIRLILSKAIRLKKSKWIKGIWMFWSWILCNTCEAVLNLAHWLL